MPSQAHAWMVEDYTLDFRSGCTPSSTNICVTETNFADYFTFTTVPNGGNNAPEDCAQVYNVDGLGNNASLTADGLLLTVKKEDVSNHRFQSVLSTDCQRNIETYHYTAARIYTITYCKYCQIDIKAKLPMVTGYWSSLWAAGLNSGVYGEIDMVEFLGKDTDGHFHISHHYSNQVTPRNYTQVVRTFSDIDSAFHTYSLVLDGELAAVHADGKYVSSYRRNKICNLKENGTAESVDCGTVQPFNQAFKIILNASGGGVWAGALNDDALPASMTIESIKVSKLDPNVKNAGFPVNALTTDYLQ